MTTQERQQIIDELVQDVATYDHEILVEIIQDIRFDELQKMDDDFLAKYYELETGKKII